MWARALAMIDEADRLKRRFFAPVAAGESAVAWEPPVDVFEDDRLVRIVVAMPGVHPDSIEVRTEPDGLVITGRRRLPPRMAVRRMEIPHGHFGRHVSLPLGRLVVCGSRYEHGCLEVELLKVFRSRGTS